LSPEGTSFGAYIPYIRGNPIETVPSDGTCSEVP
jgi:hypothetical protein